MAIENGEWIMRGLDWDNPYRIRSWQELIHWVDEIGFLPLFKNEIDGFSAEEHTSALYWWSGDLEQDPWEWRQLIARSGQVAYGKFFGKKAGFISKAWFPHFANWRRDGYDFDSRWDEELASIRQKRIMDQFTVKGQLYSFELKRLAGFGKKGQKNFDGHRPPDGRLPAHPGLSAAPEQKGAALWLAHLRLCDPGDLVGL